MTQSGAFFGWFYNDPYIGAGPPDGTRYGFPPASTLDASSGSFSYAWSTAPYPEGIWVMAAGVLDAAGNSNSTSPTKILYLDNTQPWSNVMVNPFSAPAESLVYMQIQADDGAGFLSEVQYSFIHTATGTTASTGTVSFPINQKARHYQTTEVLDLAGWSEGWYDCQSTRLSCSRRLNSRGFHV